MSEVAPRARVFSTPLESAVRSLQFFVAAHPSAFSLQQMLAFDYLMVHSGDVMDGPPSLHPATPHRSGEYIVRRALVEQGLQLLVGRGLVDRIPGSDGLLYMASEEAAPFVESLSATYFVELRSRAAWVAKRFAAETERAMGQFLADHLGEWGGEFEMESLVRELP
jgi:hypothetical protein